MPSQNEPPAAGSQAGGFLRIHALHGKQTVIDHIGLHRSAERARWEFTLFQVFPALFPSRLIGQFSLSLMS